MIDIVIVNWNGGDYVRKCTDSIFVKENEQIINNVFIIDNNSADDSLDGLIKNEKLRIVFNKKNEGFSKACNQGFRMCTSEFALLLNPDAVLLSSTLTDCIAFMEKRQDIGILGCTLLDDNGNKTYSCSRFPSPLRIFFDASGLSKIAPRIFTPGTIMTDWDHNESRQVDQVMGAFMFIRKNIFEQIGYFDERFFVYFEEVDFCKRLSVDGGKTFYNKDIKAIHSGEGTTHSVKAFRLFLSLQSRLLYAKKYFDNSGYGLVWLSTFVIEPITRVSFHLLNGDIRGCKEILKAMSLLVKRNKNR